jgi:DNA-binding transcriptional MerR regulator
MALWYISQSDAAQTLGVTTRMIQYWETQDLLHPELAVTGRNRRYTKRDLVEMRFIKALLVDQGYTVPALKEKLFSLQAPYDYDPAEVFWDPTRQVWTTPQQQAADVFEGLRPALGHHLQEALKGLRKMTPETASAALLELLQEVLLGPTRLKKPPRRTRKLNSGPEPSFEGGLPDPGFSSELF